MSISGTLYGKLALSLSVVLTGALLLQALVTMRATSLQQEVAAQRLNRELASALLGGSRATAKPALGEAEIRMAMRINPRAEIYVLDADGAIRSHGDGPALARDRVDIEPVRRLLASGAVLPIRGDDPRHPKRRAIFSAAEIRSEAALDGFVYVILEGERFQTTFASLGGNPALRFGLMAIAGVTAVGLLTALLLFRGITRPLSRLDRDMDAFAARTLAAGREPAPAAAGDEIERLRATFERLRGRVIAQLGELERVDAQRREFVANVSHDLRTPLSALRGYLETLLDLDESLGDDERRRYLDAADRHARRVSRLVDDLFELARLDAGDREPSFERFPIAELLQDVSRKFELLAAERGVHLEAVLREDLPMAVADIALIERLLENLIDNALRHTPAGGRITLRAEPNGTRLRVEVENTGPGIPAEELAAIFRRGHRGASPGEHDERRLGLGLAIVARIAEIHGTQVEASSPGGAGARFAIDLASAGEEGVRPLATSR